MGDRDHGARIVFEKALQPRDQFRIEMVGRLVEQQQVGTLQQQPAQRHSTPLAAGERPHLGLARRAAQRVHRDLDRTVELPAVGLVDLFLQFALFGDQRLHFVGCEVLGEPGADRLEPVEQRLGFGQSLDDVAEHVLLRIESRLLRQIADPRSFGGPGLARIVALLAGHDPQQGRLAGAVGTEHADLGARKKRQPDVPQHLATAGIALAEPLHHIDVLVGGHCEPIENAKQAR